MSYLAPLPSYAYPTAGDELHRTEPHLQMGSEVACCESKCAAMIEVGSREGDWVCDLSADSNENGPWSCCLERPDRTDEASLPGVGR